MKIPKILVEAVVRVLRVRVGVVNPRAVMITAVEDRRGIQVVITTPAAMEKNVRRWTVMHPRLWSRIPVAVVKVVETPKRYRVRIWKGSMAI